MRAFAPLAGIAFLADTVESWDCDGYAAVYDQLPQWDRFVRATNYYRCLYNYDGLKWDDTLMVSAKTVQSGCPAVTWKWDPRLATEMIRDSNYLLGSENIELTVETWYNSRTIFDNKVTKVWKDSDYVSLTGLTATDQKVTDYITLIWKDLKTVGCYVGGCTKAQTGGLPQSGQACKYGGGTNEQNKEGSFIANLPEKYGKLVMVNSGGVSKPEKSDACCMKSYDISTPSTKVGGSSSASSYNTGYKPKVVPVYAATTTAATTTTTSYGFDCSIYSCPTTKKVNKGKNIKCGVLQSSCTEYLCCETYATCDTLVCPDTHVNAGAKVFCKGPNAAVNIADCSALDCCKAKATCDSFKGCTGTDAAGNDISKNRGKATVCSGSCNIPTCCTAGGPTEDSCFPGEAQVSLQDRSTARVNDIETGMTVLAADGFEQVFGMLHLHSEVSPTFAHASTASV